MQTADMAVDQKVITIDLKTERLSFTHSVVSWISNDINCATKLQWLVNESDFGLNKCVFRDVKWNLRKH